MKYLMRFDLEQDYLDYIEGGDAFLPNVSTIEETSEVKYNPEHDYSKDYFTVVASRGGELEWLEPVSDAYASIDGGNTWTKLTGHNFTHPAGKILFKATYDNYRNFRYFIDSNAFAVEGNIMSLIYGDNFTGQTTPPTGAFSNFFQYSDNLTDASNLILPANVSNFCYTSMFHTCRNLTKAPELPATTLTTQCYYEMFYGCSGLNSITCHATNISASSCLNNWLSDVAASGTFNCVNGVNYPSGASGIPTGWTRVDI